MARTLAGYTRFFLAGLVKQAQTGAIVPSQRFLIEKMITPVPDSYSGRIVELGAGTGALTLRLAAKCPRARVLACEINPVLARDAAFNLRSAGLGRRVEVVVQPAQRLLAELAESGGQGLDFVISGIPLGTLPNKQIVPLIDLIHGALAPGGLYIQFQYSLLDRKKIRSRFRRFYTVPVFLNFPPAVVYFAEK